MNRRDWLTTCAVAVGVAGITLALFTPQPVRAKGPEEGSRPKITMAKAAYQGCTISIQIDGAAVKAGQVRKLTLECQNPTSKMVDFPAILSWNEINIRNQLSRVALPAEPLATRTALAANTRKARCIAFPHSTASIDILLPASAGPNSPSMRQLVVTVNGQQLMSPTVPF